jgi:hypothetical protein
VIDALFALPGFTLPAWAGLRDGVPATVAELVEGELPEGIWHHTAGAPYTDDEKVEVALAAGSRLAFPLAEQPRGFAVDADDASAVTVHWDGSALVLEARAPVRVRGVDVTR